ncbi:MAG: phosphotriesterase-related protein [Actinomycetota bacterium]|nr:phosphotriesterase-related protein [Actinomycetota bacterium]
MASSAVTVDGEIAAGALGTTLVHEHFFVDLEVWLTEPKTEPERRLADAPVGPEIERELERDPFSVRDNLHLDDDELAAAELSLFARAGGRSAVDLTPSDIGRDPARLRRLALAARVQLIMGCGHYIEGAHPPELSARREDDLVAEMRREVLEGVPVDEGPPVRAGVIGEIGTSDPITPRERKVLAAAAAVQGETGAPLFVHLDPWGRRGHDALDVAEAAGADLARVALCHLDPTLPDTDYHRSLAERGATVCYDIWGDEAGYGGKGMPTDAARMQALDAAIDQDWIDRVGLSHDVCTKTQLRRFGGPGYAHLLENVVPALERRHGSELVSLLFEQTPQRLLAWA